MTDTDTAELVAKLRASGTRNAKGDGVYMSICDQAADRLTALTAKVALLTEALKPFARIADMEERAEPESSVIVNVSRCRDARVALQPQVGK